MPLYWTQVVPPHPPIVLQLIPLRLVIALSMVAIKPSNIWVVDPKVIDQIVECPWEQNPTRSLGPKFLSNSNINEAMDGDIGA